MRLSVCVVVSLFLHVTNSLAAPAKAVPSWVAEASSTALPAYTGTTPAAVLLQEQRVDVDSSGILTLRTRKVVKVLTHEGQSSAEASVPYYRGGRRVKALRAWLIAPSGTVRTYEKSSVLDLGAYDDMELYNDLRFARIKADNPEVGSVFAYEAEVAEQLLFAQDEYAFQGELPAVRSRYILNLPEGWKAQAVLLNHPPLEPIISGSTYTWQLSNLPFHQQEEYGPELSGSVPILGVSFLSNNANGSLRGDSFRSWADVSRWHTRLSAGQADASPELIRKVQELIGPEKDEYGRIRAIAQYVQKIKYVAIEMDEAHGGGYKPHAASLVFGKQYGDCKDKANLMRSMLKVAGIDSYLVAIYSGDRAHVHPEWPSPTQFNHMIIAVRVPEDLKIRTVVNAPELGQRLLIFDPTSETTPLGDLPWYEQGSYAVIMAADKGGVLQMPVLPPEVNSTDLTVNAQLSDGGALKADCVLAEAGQYADRERSLRLYRTPGDYQHHLEQVFSERIRSAALSSIAVDDRPASGGYNVTIKLASPVYGQMMGGRLLVIGSSVVAPLTPAFPASASRAAPIVLRAGLHRKHIHIKLPATFKVDEMPVPVNEETPWGKFSYTAQEKPGEVLVEESIRIEAVTLPADQYSLVKKFFDQFEGADQQQAVLVKN